MFFMRSSALNLVSRGTASLLLLCLLVAPLCAARCSMVSCSPSGTGDPSSSGCHPGFAQSSGNAISFFSILSTSCRNADALFVALPGHQFRLLHTLANHPLPISLAARSPLSAKTAIGLNASRIVPRDSSPGDPLFTSSIPPLRL